nr:immunoglobulin heavy chain junction region [Mus musculus]
CARRYGSSYFDYW